jgi:hypothetical protein
VRPRISVDMVMRKLQYLLIFNPVIYLIASYYTDLSFFNSVFCIKILRNLMKYVIVHVVVGNKFSTHTSTETYPSHVC